MQATEVKYVGKDLEAMDFAENYHRWILELCKPFIGKHVVEVGAGTGSFSKLLLEMNPTSLDLIEPSEMFRELETNFPMSPSIGLHRNIFTRVADKLEQSPQRPDTLFYVNVLEHIEDDRSELAAVRRVLVNDGHICIFVPAMKFLFSDFDKRLGHFRRYKKSDLLKKCEDAGFKIRIARYFDFPGMLPWFIKYRIMRSLSMESKLVRMYDNVAVPIIKRFENVVSPPVGKNLLVVAQKA